MRKQLALMYIFIHRIAFQAEVTACSGIRAVPVGISKGVKKLVKAKVPDMGKYDDISEFLHK